MEGDKTVLRGQMLGENDVGGTTKMCLRIRVGFHDEFVVVFLSF